MLKRKRSRRQIKTITLEEVPSVALRIGGQQIHPDEITAVVDDPITTIDDGLLKILLKPVRIILKDGRQIRIGVIGLTLEGIASIVASIKKAAIGNPCKIEE